MKAAALLGVSTSQEVDVMHGTVYNVSMRTMAELERVHADQVCALLRVALERTGWAVAPAARALGITAPRLHRLIVAHGLEDERRRLGPGRGQPRKLA